MAVPLTTLSKISKAKKKQNQSLEVILQTSRKMFQNLQKADLDGVLLL